jgi:diacylglycerol O-acyltransferase
MGGRRLSAQDALWLTMDRPNNLMVIDVVVVLDGQVPLADVREAFAGMLSRHPVFGQRARPSGLGWEWADDPDFDLDRHVTEARLPDGSGMAQVHQFVAEQRAVALDRDRPLWRAFLVGPVILADGDVGSVVVTRFHHAIADGVRLTQVMLAILDPEYASAVPAVARTGTSGGAPATPLDRLRAAGTEVVRMTETGTKAVISSLTGAISDPGHAAGAAISAVATGVGTLQHPDRFVDVLESAGADDHRTVNDATSAGKLLLGATPRTVWTGRPGVRKAVAWSEPIDLATVKSVARHHHATVNDVLIGALAGAIRNYLAGRGDRVDEVIWMVPVNLKPFDAELPEELGNHFALVMLDMPLTGETPSDRVVDLRHRMQRIKNSDEPVLTFGLQRAISATPSAMATALTNFFANKAVGILTNVPGPVRPLAIGGVQVRQVIGFAPCSGDQPLTATIFTYAGTVTVGFASDADLVPDPQTLVSLLVQELEAMAVGV